MNEDDSDYIEDLQDEIAQLTTQVEDYKMHMEDAQQAEFQEF